ncbi:MAG TPA: putative baseplate assembly protein, partial [Chloroflexaceae bacterium]|nr:putative baseplate assembly protein [Chloroflexaceae bacterium]
EKLGRAYYKTAPRGVPLASAKPMTVIDEAVEARIASLVNPAPVQVAATVQVALPGVAAAPGVLVLGAARDGEEDGPQETTRPIVVRGADTRLQPGDYVLLVETTHDPRGRYKETPHLRQLAAVRPDRAAGTTTLDWIEEVGTEYAEGAERQLFALRVAAAPFGSSAPSWFGLPPSLTNSDGSNANAPFAGANWDEPASDWSFIPTPPTTRQEGDPDTTVFLDTLYPEVKGTPDRPGWAVLMTDDPEDNAIFHVVDVRPASKAAYAISGKVTRLVFAEGERLPARTFPLRGTVILTGSEPLELHNLLPLPDPLAGATLILAGLYPELQAGQVAILRGDLYDPARLGPLPSAETVTLAAAPALDLEHGLTTVALKGPLSSSYRRAGAALLANVVAATQGETVRDEVLGNGNGGAFQSFALRQKPLTYLPATDAEGLAAVRSTLQVTVNGVRWRERPNLLASPPDGQDYMTTTDDEGQTTVVFGDGQSGARPPTGRANIRGRYRKGLGSAGNVGAGGLQQLLDNLPGLQRVANPLPAFGGTDPEAEDEIRARAPAALRTFGRAISVEDYAALALSYPGVAKASATWATRDPATGRAIAQPYVRLTVATADLVPLARQTVFAARLRAFLDQRRDRNVPLRIADFVPVFVDVAATVDVDERHPRQATLAAALAALNPGRNPDGSLGFFAFERLGFGQSVALSAVYATLQAVPGVSSATVTTLRRPDQDPRPTTVRDLILGGLSEIAVVKNDLADEANLFGKLTLTLGKGGYLDV